MAAAAAFTSARKTTSSQTPTLSTSPIPATRRTAPQGTATGNIGDGGLQKWSLVNGTWQLDYTLSAGLDLVANSAGHGVSGLYGLTGKVVGNSVEFFATSFVLGDTDQTYLYGITDTLSDTSASQASGESFATLGSRRGRLRVQRCVLRSRAATPGLAVAAGWIGGVGIDDPPALGRLRVGRSRLSSD